jgi:hypothetical protein
MVMVSTGRTAAAGSSRPLLMAHKQTEQQELEENCTGLNLLAKNTGQD